MKTLFSLLAIAGFASAAPVNTTCPVAGKPAQPSVTTTHEGKEIAFCCNNCKGKFEADPAKYAAKIK